MNEVFISYSTEWLNFKFITKQKTWQCSDNLLKITFVSLSESKMSDITIELIYSRQPKKMLIINYPSFYPQQ